MVTERIIKSVFKETRCYYELGLKSGNKKYEEAASPWYKRWFGYVETRNRNEPLANAVVGNFRNAFGHLSILQRGNQLYSGQIAAANCDELTCVASYLADQSGVPHSMIKAVSLTAPADHIFCMIGDPQVVPLLANTKVKDLAGLAQPANPIFVIDAWANIWCAFNKYPDLFENKAKKWLGEGKRVWWKDGSQGATHYPPHGEYSDRFLASRLVVHDVN